MAMGAGNLDRRITVERASITKNDLNEEVETWPPDGGSTVGTFWASREDVSDGETVAAGMLGSHQMARFIVRSSTATKSINPKDRIKFGFDTSVSPAVPVYWNVKANKETSHGRNRFRELSAVRDADVQFSEVA